MANEQQSAQERSLEATPHKLERARRQGEVPQSRDALTVGVYAGFLFALVGFGDTMAAAFGDVMIPFLAQADQLLRLDTAPALAALGSGLVIEILTATAPLVLLPALGVALALAAQRCVVVAGARVRPRWNRLSLIANAKQRFGPKGLVEFGKTLVKLATVSGLIGWVLWTEAADVVVLALTDVRALGPQLIEAVLSLLVPVLVMSVAIASVDWLWQQADHRRRQRMTPQEFKDEQKETDVNQHFKQVRRDRAVTIATNRMLQEVPAADVVISNPTHFAVALAWDRGRAGSAPRCVAKGVDEIAQTIKRLAGEHGVPVIENRPLARSLYDLVEVGGEIRVEHYRAVAAALHYAAWQRSRQALRATPPS